MSPNDRPPLGFGCTRGIVDDAVSRYRENYSRLNLCFQRGLDDRFEFRSDPGILTRENESRIEGLLSLRRPFADGSNHSFTRWN